MAKKGIFFASALLLLSTQASANNNLYGVVSAGFTESEFDINKVDGGSYKFALGYQFHRQWYAEFGYQLLSDQSQNALVPTSDAEVQGYKPGMEGGAIFASVLGKAAGSMGELFYRVGIMKGDIKGQSLQQGTQCQLGQGQALSVGGNQYQLCAYDEGVVAGVFGLGFDFHLTSDMMLRTEVEHIRGQHNLRTNAAYIGIRYNF